MYAEHTEHDFLGWEGVRAPEKSQKTEKGAQASEKVEEEQDAPASENVEEKRSRFLQTFKSCASDSGHLLCLCFAGGPGTIGTVKVRHKILKTSASGNLKYAALFLAPRWLEIC